MGLILKSLKMMKWGKITVAPTPTNCRLYCAIVFTRERAGGARDRFTMCHELGHLMMHRGIALSRVDPNLPPKIYCNSEWQADTFASYLMMPPNLICKFLSVAEVMVAFGVSYEAAFARRSKLIGKTCKKLALFTRFREKENQTVSGFLLNCM